MFDYVTIILLHKRLIIEEILPKLILIGQRNILPKIFQLQNPKNLVFTSVQVCADALGVPKLLDLQKSGNIRWLHSLWCT